MYVTIGHDTLAVCSKKYSFAHDDKQKANPICFFLLASFEETMNFSSGGGDRFVKRDTCLYESRIQMNLPLLPGNLSIGDQLHVITLIFVNSFLMFLPKTRENFSREFIEKNRATYI